MIRRIGVALALVLALVSGVAASGHSGQVTFAGLPVPGATVTATQGTQQVTTTTDQQGVYRFADLADGVWSISVAMRGFAPASHDVTVAPSAMPEHWELMLLSFEQIAKTIPPARIESSSGGASPAGSRGEAGKPAPQAASGRDFTRTAVKPTSRAATEPPAGAPPPPPPAESTDANDGFLINGSVNNGAASPFAQPAAFGNNRRGPGSLYTGMIGVLGDTSKWDARPYSFTGQTAPQPDYNDVHAIGFFRGPFLLPGVHQNRLNVTVGFQHTANHNATTRSTVVPTLLERAGDFSQTTDAFGRAISVTDPVTGRAFTGNAIPADRLSPAALSLLQLYPQPNVSDGGRFNYQAPTLQASRQDGVQSQLVQPINSRNTLSGALSYQRVNTNNTSLFGFEDAGRVSTFDTSVLWTHRLSPFAWLRPKYELTNISNTTTPYFAGRENVSGDAGILGNDQTPENWGPPSLVFASGVEALSDAVPASTRSRTHAMGGDLFLSHGRHGLTIGADARLQRIDLNSQQDPRGRFSFNGAYSGWDFADFLLGLPRTTSIAYGNADKRFSSGSYDAYVTDDWRVSPSITVTAGARWEYETPMREALGRLVNLDIASGFSAVAPVLASDPTGALTGTRYAQSLLHPDRGGIQPRTAVAWRPVPGSSLVVRAGYGIYRNTNVYQSITTLLAQQPPLSHTFSLENSSTDPLTLVSALAAAAPAGSNTFAVDPNFRVGFAQNWQASVQRDFPFSLTITGTYLGTKGSHLMQEILPNTNPPGDDPCAACPVGFVYLTSNGTSLRHAGQIQIRRRLRNGLTWTTQYTLSKATDNATAFSGVSLSGSAIAQDWRHLDAERAPSAFDQRHLLTVSAEYTTGVGVHGGGLLTGWRGAIFKDWTMSAQMKAGSGLPYSPIYQVAVPGTGVLGTVRADLTGAPLEIDQTGYYVNPAAFAIPASGQWGSAGRNSVRGPKQFTLDASITRTFPWSGRRNWDFRVDITNLLNRVTYSTIDTVVGTPQFGQAILANPMRKIQTSLRLRF